MTSERLTKNGYTAVACYMGFLLSAGTVVQIITTRVLLLKDSGKRQLIPYLLNIVVSNSLVILGSFPTTFISSLRNGWYFSDAVCRFSGLIAGVGCIAMIATMACITVKVHFLVKHQNAVVNHIINKPEGKSYIKVLAAIWIYSFLLMLPPIVGWTDMELEAAETNCVPDWSPESLPDKIYIIFMFVFAYVVPVGLSICFLFKTQRKLSSHINDMGQQFANIRLGSLRSIYKMSAVAVIAFSLAWLPYGLFVVISLSTGNKKIFSPEGTMIPALTAKTSVIINPFIYALVLPRFRQSVIRLFLCNKGNIGSQNDNAIAVEANLNSNRLVGKRGSQIVNDGNGSGTKLPKVEDQHVRK
ncbi:melanopsin-like [Actinia tenebrosa]|uniref:Melanopsin-like n=1 Tax=Actinia tenebrosa TaxID=6105 RepID=A0A6P8I8I1_ACTTE|nr:melanopsin-like [Actinia tenebrosa]